MFIFKGITTPYKALRVLGQFVTFLAFLSHCHAVFSFCSSHFYAFRWHFITFSHFHSTTHLHLWRACGSLRVVAEFCLLKAYGSKVQPQAEPHIHFANAIQCLWHLLNSHRLGTSFHTQSVSLIAYSTPTLCCRHHFLF